MNILFFDTETTGVPKNYKAPVTDLDNWPRLVQLGWIVYSDDVLVYKTERLVRPEGFIISEQVSKIHGITQEKALTNGGLLYDVLGHFSGNIDECDLLVGHNVNYDLNVVGAEYLRFWGNNPLNGKKTVDTMLSSTQYCNFPGNYGKPKWPKLHELYQKLFNEPLAQTHTALDDIENTAKCYFELRKIGVI